MKRRPASIRRIAAVALACGLVAFGLAALAPIQPIARERLFAIPKGTAERRLAGEDIEILPQTIRLTLGLDDVLVFRNADAAPHIFGPTLIMPGQSLRLPFVQASTYSFQCTAHADGQLNVIVGSYPAPGWQRLRWRWRKIVSAV